MQDAVSKDTARASVRLRLPFFIVLLLLLLVTLARSQSSPVEVDQVEMQYAKITDKQLLQRFTEDFMIPDQNVSYLIIYDINGDGFGEGDLARTFPSGRVYLTTTTRRTQQVMNSWSFGGNVKFTAHTQDSPDQFENAPDSVRAMGGIFASLLRGLRRNYRGKPIKIHLEQDDDVTSVELWGYNPQLMQYEPPPVSRVPEEIPVMKLIYLEKTVVDSVHTGRGR